MVNETLPAPIEVTGGQVQGFRAKTDPSVTTYLAIPFAAPPLGKNRFRPPQPVEPWSGVKVCNQYGPVSPQEAPASSWGPPPLDGIPQSEDCLHLNVFVPDKAKYPEPRGVFVWLFGGAYCQGGNADPNFDGTALASKGVVVVVPNYRLHVFGWLAHPELSAEAPSGTSGMMGFLDIVQALQWVRDNIAKFGGNPDQVTVGGQSAGSGLSHAVLISPLTKGLVHGIILQSGPRTLYEPTMIAASWSYRPYDRAEKEGQALFEELGVSSLQELREYKDIDRLTKIGSRRASTNDYWGPPPSYRLTIDGYAIPDTYMKLYEQGIVKDIPIMGGQNEDEGCVYNEPRFTIDDYRSVVEGRLGPLQQPKHSNGSQELVDRFYEIYRPADEDEGKGPLQAWNAASKDNMRMSISSWGAIFNKKNKSPFYGYYFTQGPPPWHGWVPTFPPKTSNFTMNKGPVRGAFHGAELPYTFNSLTTNNQRPWTEEDRVAGNIISSLWSNFINYGNPNGKGGVAGVPEWKPLTGDANADRLMRLGRPGFGPIPLASEEGAKFWSDYFAAQTPW